MKLLALVCVVYSSLSFAQMFGDGPGNSLDLEKICKGLELNRGQDQMNCTKAKDYKIVKSAKYGANLAKLPGVVGELDPIFDLQVLPDADTNLIYSYMRDLVDNKMKVVGYVSIMGYENYEMEIRVKVVQRFNLKGELVFADATTF